MLAFSAQSVPTKYSPKVDFRHTSQNFLQTDKIVLIAATGRETKQVVLQVLLLQTTHELLYRQLLDS